MAHPNLTRFDVLELKVDRKLQLIRGKIVCLRGAKSGKNFGLGAGVRIDYPKFLDVGDNVTIGDFSYLHCLSEKGVRIGSNTSIDRHLWLHCGGRPNSYDHGFFFIGEDSFIGCYGIMGAGGGISIGNHVRIGQCVNIHAENHNFSDPTRLIRDQSVSYRGVVIEDDVWIGSKVTILDGVTIGHGSVIGAGAVVTCSIPPWSVAVGVPARVIRNRLEGRA